MISVDSLAQESPYKDYHPAEKILLCLVGIITLLLVNNYIYLGLYILLLTGFILIKARVPLKVYSLLIGVPLPFILVSCLSLMVSLDFNQGFSIAWVRDGYLLASKIFLRNIGSLLFLHCLILTTPLHHFISGLKTLHCPDILIELMLIIYKYIFIFLHISGQIYRSQQARLGYQGYWRSIQSFALLVTSLFVKSMRQGRQLFTTLLGRGYYGVLHGLHEHGTINYLRMTIFFLLNVGLYLIGRK